MAATPEEQALIEASLQRRGMVPQQPAPAAQPSPEAQAAAQAQVKAEAAQAEQAKIDDAAKAVIPNTQGDATGESPIAIKLKIGDTDREFSQSQLEGIIPRYIQDNFRRTRAKDAYNLLDAMLEKSGDDPEAGKKIAEFLHHAIKLASEHNPEMGKTPNNEQANPSGAKSNVNPNDIDWDRWAREHDIGDVTPFKSIHTRQSALEDMMQEGYKLLMDLHQAVKAGSLGKQAGDASIAQQKIDLHKQMIVNNLNGLQQEFGLADDDGPAFMQHIAKRGVLPEELSDIELARTMMTDFANAKKAGQYDRLNEVNARRQAFTGSLSSQPDGGQVSPAKPNPDMDFINAMVSKRLG